MIEIKKDTIIGDILDVAPSDRSHLLLHRYALPGLPLFPWRDCGGGPAPFTVWTWTSCWSW